MWCGLFLCVVFGKRRLVIMKVIEFDKKFDVGEDVSDVIDWFQVCCWND